MKKETVLKAVQFMQRVQLTGAEVPAWLEVMAALEEATKPKIPPMPAAPYKDESDAAASLGTPD